MSMTDPIADMLTRIRNACGAKHRRVDMPGSKMKVEIARILKENNFIQDFRTLEEESGRKTLRVVLKYAQGGQPVIRELKRVSTPGLRKYVGVARDSARSQRPRHGDSQHVAGSDVGPSGAPDAHRRRDPRARLVRGANNVTYWKESDCGSIRRHDHARWQPASRSRAQRASCRDSIPAEMIISAG